MCLFDDICFRVLEGKNNDILFLEVVKEIIDDFIEVIVRRIIFLIF